MTARTTARRLSGFAASRSLTVASVGLPSGLVMVGSPSGVGDVRHHQPAMTACLRRFAEPSARYSEEPALWGQPAWFSVLAVVPSPRASCQDLARLLRLDGHRIDATRVALD